LGSILPVLDLVLTISLLLFLSSIFSATISNKEKPSSFYNVIKITSAFLLISLLIAILIWPITRVRYTVPCSECSAKEEFLHSPRKNMYFISFTGEMALNRFNLSQNIGPQISRGSLFMENDGYYSYNIIGSRDPNSNKILSVTFSINKFFNTILFLTVFLSSVSTIFSLIWVTFKYMWSK
jgi:hypothetical protein